jgi:hypothetical protein
LRELWNQATRRQMQAFLKGNRSRLKRIILEEPLSLVE